MDLICSSFKSPLLYDLGLGTMLINDSTIVFWDVLSQSICQNSENIVDFTSKTNKIAFEMAPRPFEPETLASFNTIQGNNTKERSLDIQASLQEWGLKGRDHKSYRREVCDTHSVLISIYPF